MNKYALYIATTSGPSLVRSLTREASRHMTAVTLRDSIDDLPITPSYKKFVGSVIHRYFEPHDEQSGYLLDVDSAIESGNSWKLGACLAHVLSDCQALTGDVNLADEVIWVTGDILRGLDVKGIGWVSDKLRASDVLFKEIVDSGKRLKLVFPESNRDDVEQSGAALVGAGAQLVYARHVNDVLEQLGVALVGHAATHQPRDDIEPYVGLRPFTNSEHSIYFGRDAAIDEAREKLLGLLVQQNGFLLLTGPSGAGKSSILHAGILPALRTSLGLGNYYVHLWLSCTPAMARGHGNDVFELLRDRLLDLIGISSVPHDPKAPGELADEVLVSLRAADKGGKALLLVLIDQFEEWFTTEQLSGKQESLHFLSTLVDSGRVCVIGAIRSEFLGQAQELTPLYTPTRSGQIYYLRKYSPGEIREIISRPLEIAGYQFDSAPDEDTRLDLEETLVKAAQDEPESVPLLQFALQQLFESREAKRLTWAAYRRIGGVEGAVSAYGEKIYQGLSEPEKSAFSELVFNLVAFEEGPITEKTIGLNSLSKSAQSLCWKLIENRLLTTSQQPDGEQLVRFSHLKWVTAWNRISDLLDTHKEFVKWLNQIKNAERGWRLANKDKDLLLPPGKPLLEAISWTASESKDAIQPEIASFIEESVSRFKRRRSFRVTAVVGALVVLLALSIFALGALSRALSSESSLLAGQSYRELQAGDVTRAAQTALQGLDKGLLHQSSEPALHALYGSIQVLDKIMYDQTGLKLTAVSKMDDGVLIGTSEGALFYRLEGQNRQIDSPHSTEITTILPLESGGFITVDFSGTFAIWESREAEPWVQEHEYGPARMVTVSESQSKAGFAWQDGAASVWDIESRSELISLDGFDDAAECLDFSPDEKLAAIGTRGGSLIVVDLTEGRQLSHLNIGEIPVWSGRFLDDSNLAIGLENGKIQIRTTDGAFQETLDGHIGRVTGFSMSPDGRRLLSQSLQGETIIWNLENHQMMRLQILESQLLGSWWLGDFSIVVADSSGMVTEFSAFSGEVLRRAELVTPVVSALSHFSDRELVIGNYEGALASYTTVATPNQVQIVGEDSICAGFLPGVGMLQVTRSGKISTRSSNTSSNTYAILQLQDIEKPVISCAFSNRELAISTSNGEVILLSTPTLEPALLSTVDLPVVSLAFGRSGTALAGRDVSGTVRFWNVDTGKLVAQLGSIEQPILTITTLQNSDAAWLLASEDQLYLNSLENDELVLNGEAPLAVSFVREVSDNSAVVFARDSSVYRVQLPSLAVTHSTKVDRTVTSALATRDFSTLMLGTATGEIQLRSLPSLDLVQEFRAHASAVTALSEHPILGLFTSAGRDRLVSTWDLEFSRRIEVVSIPTAIDEIYTDSLSREQVFLTYGGPTYARVAPSQTHMRNLAERALRDVWGRQ